MDDDQQSAYDLLSGLFASFGLPSSPDIMNVIRDSAINGDSSDMTQLRLQDTDTWKKRFAGNEKRKAQGLDVLSVAEYLQQEKSYSDVLHGAGVPNGFYDDPSDFADFIGNSLSVAELQDRVNIAGDIVSREDPAVMQQLALRGLSSGSLIAHALDPQRAAPLIKRDMNSILIGAAATRAGLSTTVDQSNDIASRNIGEQQATQGFGQIADFYDTTNKLGNVYGVDYGTQDAISEVFDGGNGATRKRLASQEKAAFGGGSNYGVNQKPTGGQF